MKSLILHTFLIIGLVIFKSQVLQVQSINEIVQQKSTGRFKKFTEETITVDLNIPDRTSNELIPLKSINNYPDNLI